MLFLLWFTQEQIKNPLSNTVLDYEESKQGEAWKTDSSGLMRSLSPDMLSCGGMLAPGKKPEITRHLPATSSHPQPLNMLQAYFWSWRNPLSHFKSNSRHKLIRQATLAWLYTSPLFNWSTVQCWVSIICTFNCTATSANKIKNDIRFIWEDLLEKHKVKTTYGQTTTTRSAS